MHPIARLLLFLGWTPPPVHRLRESFADLRERYRPTDPRSLPILPAWGEGEEHEVKYEKN